MFPPGNVKSDDSMFFKDSKTICLVNDQYRDKLFSEEGAAGSMGGMSPVPQIYIIFSRSSCNFYKNDNNFIIFHI